MLLDGLAQAADADRQRAENTSAINDTASTTEASRLTATPHDRGRAPPCVPATESGLRQRVVYGLASIEAWSLLAANDPDTPPGVHPKPADSQITSFHGPPFGHDVPSCSLRLPGGQPS